MIQLAELYDADDEFAGLIDETITAHLNEQIDGAWHDGWQPADIVCVLRRNATELLAAMAADGMAAQLSAYDPATVDESFMNQLAALGADPGRGTVIGFFRRRARRPEADCLTAIATAFELADMLSHLPELPLLCPPPGRARRVARSRTSQPVDPKLLERVRALLAKAESSEYGAEADALTAKAQELMVRHSIDQALLDAATPTAEQPGGIRIALQNPYEAEKAALLDQVASANRCKAIWSRHLGFVTVLGFPAELRTVELLFTSLLVQATRAMLGAGARQTASGTSRTRSFRQAFLNAFAIRIGERLTGVNESGIREGAASDARLLPVLADRAQAVHQLAAHLFPGLTYRGRDLYPQDREGWALGTHAANLAALTAIPSITPEAAAGPASADAALVSDSRCRVEAIQEPLFAVPH
ncbi:MAG TPA: DUF2786 domain-containing protein [Micromonosporaceae bacterium]